MAVYILRLISNFVCIGSLLWLRYTCKLDVINSVVKYSRCHGCHSDAGGTWIIAMQLRRLSTCRQAACSKFDVSYIGCQTYRTMLDSAWVDNSWTHE